MSIYGNQRIDPADREPGYTLTELVVVLGVLAVLTAWAVPNFGHFSRSAARTSAVNQFIQAVYLARGEAIKRNGVVSLCPSRDGATCDVGSPWDEGWLVFVNLDRDSPADRDADEELLQVYPPWESGQIAANRTTLSFRPFGQSGVTATLTFCDDRGRAEARAVIISQTGRPRIADQNSSGGPLDCG
jgi:type IV fimbrial biogenesis protein FimT